MCNKHSCYLLIQDQIPLSRIVVQLYAALAYTSATSETILNSWPVTVGLFQEFSFLIHVKNLHTVLGLHHFSKAMAYSQIKLAAEAI